MKMVSLMLAARNIANIDLDLKSKRIIIKNYEDFWEIPIESAIAE